MVFSSPPAHRQKPSARAAFARGDVVWPGAGSSVVSNQMGSATSANGPGAKFDFCFRPTLGGSALMIGHGYISSTQGDGPHAPLVAGVPLGGATPAVLPLDASQVNADGTSYAVLQVIPDAKGQITAATVAQPHGLEIVQSKDASPGSLATLGRTALALILWSKNVPVKVLPIIQWNLQYRLYLPTAGNGAPQHFFF